MDSKAVLGLVKFPLEAPPVVELAAVAVVELAAVAVGELAVVAVVEDTMVAVGEDALGETMLCNVSAGGLTSSLGWLTRMKYYQVADLPVCGGKNDV
ncbi:MAG TPA: hypothetical protein VL122_08840 [Nitrospirota bacterium]|nr:hypothetical protein [Nitrospirota bacterium]